MPATLFLQVLANVGPALAIRAFDLFFSKKEGELVTREDYLGLRPMINESHAQHIAEAEAANP